MKVDVMEGRVVVNSVGLLVDGESAKVVHIECATKRPAFDVFSMDDGSFLAILDADEHTLRCVGGQHTEIAITELDGEWNAALSGGRYSVYLFLWRRDAQLEDKRSLYERDRSEPWAGIPADKVKAILEGGE